MRWLCALAWLLLWILPAQATAAPSLLILPLEMTDTSGEANPRAEAHAERLAGLARQLGQDIEADASTASWIARRSAPTSTPPGRGNP
jgi:hypothetical protein